MVVVVACVRLGVWQLSRLHQRRARNAVIRAAMALPPIELTGSVAAESLSNRRVTARGVYDFANERLWRPRSFNDVPGVDLVTPLRIGGGKAVLVDRGFVASPDAYHVDQAAFREPDSATVLGLALPAPRGRGDVDPGSLSDSLPYRLLPFVLQALPDRSLPLGAAAPRRLAAPELTDGPHLSYAIQWFSFAAIILIGSLALARKERGDRGLSETPPTV